MWCLLFLYNHPVFPGQFLVHAACKELIVCILHHQIRQSAPLTRCEFLPVKADFPLPLFKRPVKIDKRVVLPRAIVTENTNDISRMGFKTDILKYIRAFLIRERQVLYRQQVLSIGTPFFFVIVFRIPFRVACP